MTGCPLHDCSMCGRHIAPGRIAYRLKDGRILCVRCLDRHDLYDQLSAPEATR